MRVIRLFEIILAYIFMLAFAVFLVAGVFNKWFFFAAAAALACYFILNVWRLHCPWCGGPVELSALFRGLKKGCHCPSCGHEITVVVRVGRRGGNNKRKN